FDFGSPTAGAIFNIERVLQGTPTDGLHSYLRGEADDQPMRLDVWDESDRSGLRGRPPGAGRLVLFPGDRGGGEFASTPETVERGLLDAGAKRGHDRAELNRSIRFVRTAVVDPGSPELEGLRPVQLAWLEKTNQELQALAGQQKVGRTVMLGQVPLDPVLQWR